MPTPEVVTLNGRIRETGRNVADTLRDAKRVPGVLYGPKVDENIHFSIDEIEFEKILAVSKRQIIELEVNGETHPTLLKDVEFHPITDRPIHVDLYALADDHEVTISVPIHLEGTPVGVTDDGGRTFQPLQILRIRVTPDLIPGAYTVDISDLKIGDSLHVRDLELEGVTPLDDLDSTLVTIRPPRSEELLTSSLITEEPSEEELAEAEEELAEAEEAVEGEEAEEGEDAGEDEGEQ